MVYNVGDIIQTKSVPKTLGIITDIIYIMNTNKTVFQIFFEDSDELEWYYKENFSIVKDINKIQYMNKIYKMWRNENGLSTD